MPITTKVVSSNPANCEIYSIHYVIKFVIQVSGVFWVLRFSTIKTDRHDITEILLKVVLSIITLTLKWILVNLIFSSPGPKVHVNYCHHLASVVRRLSSVVCKLFTFQASSPKPLGRLEPNLAGMFLGWSSTKLLFFVPVGCSIWLPRPIICSDWLKFQRSSSLKLMN